MRTERNWAGNLTYRATRLAEPTTREEARREVVGSGRIKAVGTRHSFSAIGDTDGTLLSTRHWNRILAVEPETGHVTLEPGVTYGQLGPVLHAAGLALPNLASLPHLTVAGACATATHGSGDGHGVLSSSVVEMDLLLADGEVQTFRRDDPEWDGVVVHLGLLGVVSRLVLQTVPARDLVQRVFLDLPLASGLANFDAVMGCAPSVSLFSQMRGDRFDQVWVKGAVGPGPSLLEDLGMAPADRAMHPIAELSPIHCNDQMGIPGPWYERLPHFRMDFTPSSGDELQSEFLLSRSDAPAALEQVFALREKIAPVLQVCEVRTMAGDAFWMSPAQGRPTVGIHFTWVGDLAQVRPVLESVEAALSPFGPRPHWGKITGIDPAAIRLAFGMSDRFASLVRQMDPVGKFRNDGLYSVLGLA